MAESNNSEILTEEPAEDSPQSYSLVGRGQALHIQVKQAIVNLKCYFQQKNGWKMNQTIAEISEALKISFQAVKRVIYEERRTKTLAAPKSKGRIKKGFQFDTNDRQILMGLCKEVASRTKTATVTDVISFIKANKHREDVQQLKFKDVKSDNTFRKIFHTMGLRFGQINGKNVLMLKNMVKIKPELEKPKPTPKPFKLSSKALKVRRQPIVSAQPTQPSPQPTPKPKPTPKSTPQLTKQPPSQPTPPKPQPKPLIINPFPSGSLIAVPVSNSQPIIKSVGSFPNPIHLGSIVMKLGSVQPKLILSNKTVIKSPNVSKSTVKPIVSNKTTLRPINSTDMLCASKKPKPPTVAIPIVPIQSLRVGNPGHDYSRSNSNKNKSITNNNIVVLTPMSDKQSNSGSVSARVVKLIKPTAETGGSVSASKAIPISKTVKNEESILPSEPIIFD